MTLSDLSLIIVYTCLLVIKNCDPSSISTATLQESADGVKVIGAMCRTYGFGESPNGKPISRYHADLSVLAISCGLSSHCNRCSYSTDSDTPLRLQASFCSSSSSGWGCCCCSSLLRWLTLRCKQSEATRCDGFGSCEATILSGCCAQRRMNLPICPGSSRPHASTCFSRVSPVAHEQSTCHSISSTHFVYLLLTSVLPLCNRRVATWPGRVQAHKAALS